MPGAEDDKKMPLLDHLVELRRRLLYSVLALFIAFIFCFYFAQHIFNFLAQPLANILLKETGRRFIYTDLTEVFFTQVKVAVFGAACITFPIIASQIWMFVAPGLYKVRISKIVDGKETIPDRYNKDTEFGLEVAQDNPDMRTVAPRFKMTSK